MNYKIVSWDFEVKQDWWCVSFGIKKDITKNCLTEEDLDYTTFQTGQELDLIDYIIKNRSNTVFVGYNSCAFDNYCLKCIWHGINPWKVVQHVIVNKEKPYTIPDIKFKKNIDFMSYDLMQAIGINAKSLKDAEACMGIAIQLDDLMDKTTGLNAEEKQKTISYNRHDVFATMCLYDRLHEELESVMMLVEKFNLPKKTLSRKKQQIFEVMYEGKFKTNITPFDYNYKAPSFITLLDNSVKDKMESFKFTKDNDFSVEFEWDGGMYSIKRGGAHHARKNYIQSYDGKKILVLNDFSSFYLGIMANPTNEELRYIDKIIDWKEVRGLVDMRLDYKARGNKPFAKALKVPLVAIFGKTASDYFKYSYWPTGLNICLTGQLITLMICQELKRKNIGSLIQVNTDGFYYELDSKDLDEFNKTMDEFQKRIGIDFEREIISKGKIVQRDVNNYIIYNEETGKVKAKGCVNKYKSKVDYYQNTKSIVTEAVAEYLLHGTPVNKTVMDAWTKNEARKFQIVYNMSGKNYIGCYYGHKKIQKINRGFASANSSLPDIRKLKDCTYEKFPDAPDHVYIYNDDVSKLDIRKINLDVQFYIDLALKGIRQFKGQ